ncbi:methyltransferase, FxLD system [Streptomyces sp. NPDC090442]|uniref:methyltransferase, FxLD system n=1 Tax=Streptomyces sp. NPDC090442 TaxID=3365962 RepID=UPI003813EC17
MPDTQQLRQTMVDQLRELDAIRTSQVEQAFLAVPRERFAPGEPLEKVYGAETAVITKRDEHGNAVSSVSAPRIQAFMLEQAQPRPGDRCLEIGSGGYNAALLREMVGPTGLVATLDIDRDVTDRARRCLEAAGYSDVEVLSQDGEFGAPELAPFDLIMVTVGAWDIAPAWISQLSEGGRLVVPIRVRGLTRSIVFERQGDHLRSLSSEVCGFVKMQGAGAHEESLVLLRGKEAALRFDEQLPAGMESLAGVLEQAPVESWSDVTVGQAEPFDSLYLWLASVLTGFCLVSVDPSLDSGVVTPANKMACPALVDGGSFAYLTLRKVSDAPKAFAFGAKGHGPDADTLVKQIVHEVTAWDQSHRGGPEPVFTAYPAGTPDDQMPAGLVVDKRHARITVSWP